mmetsp:Transcript_69352/g.104594  ORF Transcript_69352/g.104594 Transcript_69352/m.104594 type:complete len:485 (+) Transcript_69352:16-1470(+)
MGFVLPFKISPCNLSNYSPLKLTIQKNSFKGKEEIESKSQLKSFRNITLLQMQQKSESSLGKNDWLQSFFSTQAEKEEGELGKWKKVSKNVLNNTPIPSDKDESWRLTPLSKLFEMNFSKIDFSDLPSLPEKFLIQTAPFRAVYINGVFSEESSNFKNLPENVFIGSLKDFDENKKEEILDLLSKGESGIDGGFFPLLNMSCLQDILVISIPEGAVILDSIHVIFAGFSEKKTVNFNPRLVILAGTSSVSKIIEHHVSIGDAHYFDNSATTVLLEKNSKLDFTFLNEVSENSSQISSIHVNEQKGSFFNFKSLSFGGFLSRISLGIDMNGIGSSCKVNGLTVAKETQISDFHSRISHNFPRCQSSQLQKNLITGKAQGIFAGKIQVQHGAFETESDQLSKTLLLSSKAKIDALPILEINNENVKCTHGSTVSDLDENQIFYFQSRGITQEKARYLLTIGFVEEIIKGLPDQLLKRVSDFINSFL